MGARHSSPQALPPRRSSPLKLLILPQPLLFSRLRISRCGPRLRYCFRSRSPARRPPLPSSRARALTCGTRRQSSSTASRSTLPGTTQARRSTDPLERTAPGTDGLSSRRHQPHHQLVDPGLPAACPRAARLLSLRGVHPYVQLVESTPLRVRELCVIRATLTFFLPAAPRRFSSRSSSPTTGVDASPSSATEAMRAE